MQTRRSLLARLAAGASAAAVASLAGCIGTEGVDDDPSLPEYARSLYDPGEVGATDPAGRLFVSHDLATLYERREVFPGTLPAVAERVENSVDPVSVGDLEQLTGLVYWRDTEPVGPDLPTGGVSVLVRGPDAFDPDAVIGQFRAVSGGSSVDSAGRVAGHDLYTVTPERDEQGSGALALSADSMYLGATAGLDAPGEDAVRAMLTTDAGYYDAGDTGSRLVDTLGEATSVFGLEFDVASYVPPEETAPLDGDLQDAVRGLVGVGGTTQIGAETTTQRLVGVYDDEAPAEADLTDLVDTAVQRLVAADGDGQDERTVWESDRVEAVADDLEITREGRTITGSVSRDTDDLAAAESAGRPVGLPAPPALVALSPGLTLFGAYLLSDDPVRGTPRRPPSPRATFDFEYDASSGAVSITHTGGDRFTEDNTEELLVRIDGPDDRSREPVTWPLPVAAGDSITVEATAGDAVIVLWLGPDDRTVAVATFEVPG